MTKEILLKYQLTHSRGGNGFACVQFDPEGDTRFIRVTVWELSPGLDPKGKPYPPEPVKLDDVQLGHLQPFRDGLADGTLKCVLSHVVPAGKAATAALV